jgi:hypothetical protein
MKIPYRAYHLMNIMFLMLIISACFVSFNAQATHSPHEVRHVVIFKYKPNTTQQNINIVSTAFRELQYKIPGIVSFEEGVNNSPENKNLGFTHVYTLTFQDIKARDTYLPHPIHKQFQDLVGRLEVLDDAFVVDYIPQTHGPLSSTPKLEYNP